MPDKLPSLKNLSRRQRSFCRRIAGGEEAEAIIPELFPHQAVGLVLCRLMANQRIAEFLASVVQARISPNLLLLKLGEILDDPDSSRTNVLAAARLSSQLLGYLRNSPKGKKRGRISAPTSDDDEALAEKLVLLAKKAAAN